MRRLVISAVVVALVVAAAPAWAAKGGNGKGKPNGDTSSLSVVMVEDANGDAQPNHGDVITFDITTTVSKPFVKVNCYQGSAWVYSASVGYFDAYPWAQQFTLSASSWQDGAADCTATLYTTKTGKRIRTHATLDFQVAA